MHINTNTHCEARGRFDGGGGGHMSLILTRAATAATVVACLQKGTPFQTQVCLLIAMITLTNIAYLVSCWRALFPYALFDLVRDISRYTGYPDEGISLFSSAPPSNWRNSVCPLSILSIFFPVHPTVQGYIVKLLQASLNNFPHARTLHTRTRNLLCYIIRCV
jgi:hypothetical protein